MIQVSTWGARSVSDPRPTKLRSGVRSPRVRGRIRTEVGLSLLELLITVTLIMIMVGGAMVNHSMIVEEQKAGKALNECQQFVKALKVWENKKGRPVTEYIEGPGGRYKFVLRQLESDRIMPQVPDDPWSMPYDVDTTRGYVFSYGPDTRPNTSDDIRAYFRAKFRAEKAFCDASWQSITVVFSRPIDRTKISTDLVKVRMPSKEAAPLTTLWFDMADPYRVKAVLAQPYPPTTFTVSLDAMIHSQDGTPLFTDQVLTTGK